MKCAMFIYCITPHLMPLAKELRSSLGEDGFAMVYLNEIGQGRADIGWSEHADIPVLRYADAPERARKILETAENLIVEVRDPELFETRSRKGLKTFYTSERWFKPHIGMLKLVSPRYLKMAFRIARLMTADPNFCYLPVGIHAATDMLRLCSVVRGKIEYLVRVPEVSFERRPGGRISSGECRGVLDKVHMWAYFIAESKHLRREMQVETDGHIRVLWVGRELKLKRVDDIIQAIQRVNNMCGAERFSLDVYGTGPAEQAWRSMAADLRCVRFQGAVSVDEVRNLMRAHDVYVFSSDCHDGWGAVVGEALEEGMRVIGTFEAGASATLLPDSCLYHAGDVKRLSELLMADLPSVGIGSWTPGVAAHWLLSNMA